MYSSGDLSAVSKGGIDLADALIPALSIQLFRELQQWKSLSPTARIWKRIRPMLLRFKNSNGTGQQEVQLQSSFDNRSVDVLFWPVERNHFDQHIEVASYLQKADKSIAFIISTAEMGKLIKAAGMPYIEVSVKTGSYKQPLTRLKVHGAESNFTSLLKEKYWDLYPLAKFSLSIIKAVSKNFQIGHLVVGYDIALQGRLAALAMKKQGVPTSCIMHGTLSFEYEENGQRADKLYLFGENDAAKMQVYGGDYDLVGAPYLDGLMGKASDRGVFDEFVQDPETGKVLIATSGPGTSVSLQHHLALLKSFERLARKFSDLFFLIKLHRKDKQEYYQQLEKLENVKVIPFQNEYSRNIFDWFTGCDALITGASTTGLEAQVVNIPVASLDLNDEIGNTYYMGDRVTEYCTSDAELEGFIKRVVVDKQSWRGMDHYDAVRRNYFYKVDGKSAERVAQSVMQNIVESV